jgi:uncharacterized membrane protein
VDEGWLAVRWLHVLAMALFVGGQIVLVAAIVPVLRGGDRHALRAIARRFGWASWSALGVLIASGVALASRCHWWDVSTLHVKLALVVAVAVAVLIVWHMAARAPTRSRGWSSSSRWGSGSGSGLAHGPPPFG